MVFGFGDKGSIELILEKYSFMPGDTIKGRVILKLKKPVSAKQLRVVFWGEKQTRSRGSDGRSKSRSDLLHRFELALDGEKEYTGGEYPLEIKIPENVLDTGPEPEGALGDAVKAIQFLSGASTKISWFIEASLDVPKGFDVSKKVQITVG